MTDATDQKRFHDNLQAEIDGAALYRALAKIEHGSELAAVYTRMAEACLLYTSPSPRDS